MKICFYNVTASYKSGGLETYCWEVGYVLAKRGHDVSIVAGINGQQRYYNVKLIGFPFKDRSSFPDFGTRFQKLFERLSFGINSWRHLIEASYDVVIINKPFDMPIIWWAKKRGLKSRIVFRSGGTDFFFGDKLFKSAVDIWISASFYNAQQIKSHYGVEVKVIHNGVNTNVFLPAPKSDDFKKKLGIPRESHIIMSVGRVIGLKGLNVIIDIMSYLQNCHYVVIGNGPSIEQLKNQAKRLNVSHRVHFLGEIPHRELPKILPEADVFVQPSIGEEAFGITVVEAMACGVPVCASKIGGMPEIVIDGETGLLLPAGDTEAWRIALQTLLKQPNRIREMGINARARAVQHFTWDANVDKLEQIITKGEF